MITEYSRKFDVPFEVLKAAESIKHLNNKTKTPKHFQKNRLTEDLAKDLMLEISKEINVPYEKLDYVFFSALKGADPHTDLLDPAVFSNRTFLMPILTPWEGTELIVGNVTMEIKNDHLYEFNHEVEHGLSVMHETGCVLIMVAIKH